MAAAQPSDASSRSRLLAEQVELLYRHAPSIYAGNALAASGLALMVWDQVERAPFVVWLGVLALLTAGRMALVGFWRRQRGQIVHPARWANAFAAGAGLSGLLWGVMGGLFSGPDPLQMASVGVVLAGLVSASVSSLSVYYPAYAVFALPAILPIAFRCLQSGDCFMRGFALISIGFVVICLIFAWLNNRSIRAAILLRFENLELLREVSAQREQATAAREQAEQANVAKTRFLAAASHDLRQPLQALSLFIDAQAHHQDAAAMQQLNGRMREAADNMGLLLDNLLDYARIETGALSPQCASVPLTACFARLQSEFAPIAAERGLALRFRPTPHHGVTDAALFEHILRNLVGNALRYTEKGGVLVACRRRGDSLVVEVRDSGIGIPEASLGDVFKEFYQPVSVRSQPGRGSVFSITLPRGEAPPPVIPVVAVTAAQRLNGRRVLVIDNEADIREALAALMRSWGVDVMVAESATAAIALDGPAPDAILADFRLHGGCTGIDAIAALRAHHRFDIPAALITGDTDPARTREARAAGFTLLQKPTPAHRLAALLDYLLEPAA